jgi:hypothetical protein
LRRLSLAALLRNACHAQTMRLLWREVRPGPPALVSDAILLEALPGEIPCQGRRAKKAGAPLAGFPARGVISIRSRAPQWRFPAWPALRGREGRIAPKHPSLTGPRARLGARIGSSCNRQRTAASDAAGRQVSDADTEGALTPQFWARCSPHHLTPCPAQRNVKGSF